MKHPIYKDESIVALLGMSVSGRKRKFNEISKMPDLDASMASHIIREYILSKQIMEDGHVLVNVIGDDWYNDISEKTFMGMKLQDIKLPYKSAWINLGNEYIAYAVTSKGNFIKELDAISVGTDTWSISDELVTINLNGTILNINTDSTIDEFVNNVIHDSSKDGERLKEIRNYLTKFLSIMLYISAFKKDNDRVTDKKVRGDKSKIGNVKKHIINVVKLYQVETGGTKDGCTWKSDKKWLVRGHWRNQFYKTSGEHKPKWIDPFWKGSGNEEVKKIYKMK